MTITYIDRSRVISYQVCNRKRYLNYHHNQIGIQKDSLNVNLFVGSAVHKGLEILLNFCVANTCNGVMPDDFNIEFAVEGALEYFDSESLKRNFTDVDDPSFKYYELRNLVEAMIRVYALIQLPKLLEEYEILEVEKEYEWWLVEPDKPVNPCGLCKSGIVYNKVYKKNDYELIASVCTECNGTGYRDSHLKKENGILFMSRPDALIRHKQSGELFILSFKTASSVPDDKENRANWEAQNKYDMQGLSEIVAVERNLNREYESRVLQGRSEVKFDYVKSPLKISGIKMEFLIKGSKVYRGENAGWINNSIIHPWKSSQTDELSHKYEWQDEFGNKKRLGKNWQKCNIWDQGETTLKDWIQYLYENDKGFLEQWIVTPEIYNRNTDDIQDFLESTIAQETRIIKWIEDIEKNKEEGANIVSVNTALNIFFPKVRSSCFSYNSKCSYWEICWLGLSADNQDFVPREINHPKEGEIFNV